MENGRKYDNLKRSNIIHHMDEPNRGTPKQFPSHEQMRVQLPPQNPGTAAARPCVNAQCGFYGTLEFDFFCSKCYHSNLQQNKANEKSPIRPKGEEQNSNDNSIVPEVTRQQHSMSNTIAQGR